MSFVKDAQFEQVQAILVTTLVMSALGLSIVLFHVMSTAYATSLLFSVVSKARNNVWYTFFCTAEISETTEGFLPIVKELT